MDDEERQVAKAAYEYNVAEAQAAQRYQIELAKWILASLILVNGGALVLLANSNDPHLIANFGAPFVIGIASAIISGFLGWLNAGVRDLLFSDYAQPESLKTGAVANVENAKLRERQVIWSYRLSIIAGFASLGGFLWGALAIV